MKNQNTEERMQKCIAEADSLGCRIKSFVSGQHTVRHKFKPEIIAHIYGLVALEMFLAGMRFRENCATGQLKENGQSLFEDLNTESTATAHIQLLADAGHSQHQKAVEALGAWLAETGKLDTTNPSAICVVSGFEANKYVTKFELKPNDDEAMKEYRSFDAESGRISMDKSPVEEIENEIQTKQVKTYKGRTTKFAEKYRQNIEDNDKIIHEEGQSCTFCGKMISENYILRKGHCFSCDFWLDVAIESDEAKPNEYFALCENIYASNDTGQVEPGATLYQFQAGRFEGRWLGSGGRLISFEYPDGRIVQSNNVSCRGQVPKHFLHLFKKFSAKIIDKGWIHESEKKL